MNFLYPAFLIGGLAIALPIVLHLLRRDVAPEVPFTAVRLLRRSPIERSKRRRLRDLLLLAARIIALLLLAVAFARPYIVGAATTARVRLVAVDRSYSMGAPGRFARALDLARAAVEEAGEDRVAIVAFDERADLLAGPGPAADARTALNTIQPGFGATRYAPVVTKAIEAADGAAGRLVIVTDLQRAGWDDEQPVVVPSTLQVEISDAGETSQNIAVVNVRVQANGTVASVGNAGSARRSGRVRIALDGRDVAAAPFVVDAGAMVDVPIGYRPPASGSLAVTIEDPDGMPADDTRYVVLDPLSVPRVLVVTSGGSPMQSGFYLTRALQATAGEENGFEPVASTGTAVAGMTAEQISRYAAIVLLSTRGLDRRARDTLGTFVRRGGGLLITGAPEVEPSTISNILDLRPPLSPSSQAGRPFALAATDLRHPIFRPFGALAANLGQVRFERAWRVDSDGWEVAARFTDGRAALLERAALFSSLPAAPLSRDGHVVLFTSDLDRRWNDFPLHPAFVPFAIEAVRYAAGGREQTRSYTVAQAPAGAPPRPGVYQLPPDNHRIAINVDARESALARMTADEFSRMIQRVERTASEPANVRAHQTEARQSYWRYGLILMLATLIAESVVGRVA